MGQYVHVLTRHVGPMAATLLFIEPRFLNEKQPQKPHNKPKKTQMTLREKKLSLELKLGGESDYPTLKGKP